MELYVDKDTDLMMATFVATGLANVLLSNIRSGSGAGVRIRDLGTAYQLELTGATREDIEGFIRERGQLYPSLDAITKPMTAKEKALVEAGTPREIVQRKYIPAGFSGAIIDYESEKAKPDPVRFKDQDVQQERGITVRHPDFPQWAHFCSYFGKGSAMRSGYPGVLHAWHAHQGEWACKLFDLIVYLYTNYPNPAEAVRQTWKKEFLPELGTKYEDYPISTDISSLAIVSPSTSKGVSAQTVATTTLSEDTPDAFWLPMYLAFVGFMTIGMPYNSGSDVVTYYPLPRDISLTALQGIMESYRRNKSIRQLYSYSGLHPRIKLDALAHITFYKAMLEHFRDQAEEEDVDPWFALPDNSIHGFAGYYYKDISTQIPFDETIFGEPRWLSANPGELDYQTAIDVLEIHRRIIDSLRGRGGKITSDELVIIDHYRRFITSGDIRAWIDFASVYNQYRVRNYPDLGYLPLLTTDVFEETIMDRKNYRPIFENEGFQHIANAIREATVDLIYRTKRVNNPENSNFHVMYGLGDDIKRNAHDPDAFAEALGDFIHQYQQESYNVLASSGQRRYNNISPDDINTLLDLIPEYGSQVVAKLLVAYGYSSVIRKSANEEN